MPTTITTSQTALAPTPTRWRIENNWLVSPAGAKVAQIIDGMLYLYDKRTHQALPFSSADWLRLVANAKSAGQI